MEAIEIAAKAAVTQYYRDQAAFRAGNATAGIKAAGKIIGKYVT